ncbi:dihydroorotase family protein [Chloroflexota bacterium]
MQVDTLIKNGKLVTPDGVFGGTNIGITNGKIAYVGTKGLAIKARETIDARGNYVLPGVIDAHCHFNPPGQSFEDCVLKETKAAAFGGVTTAFHFITEGGSICERLPYYAETVKKLATIDMGFQAIVWTQDHLKEMPRCCNAGLTGFKFMMAYKGGELRAIGIEGPDYAYLYQGMEAAAKVGGVVQVHAENWELLQLFKARNSDKNDFTSYCNGSPPVCEEVDVYAICKMAEATGCNLYIVHVTVGNTLNIVKEFRDRKTSIFTEISPRYLTIDNKATGLKRPLLAVGSPPMKSRANIGRLWKGVAAGEIDCIATDSGSVSYQNKGVDGGVPWKMFPGWQEMPVSLALMLSEGVNKKRITLPQVAALMSYNPARVFGIYPKKGAILPGSDADITIVDLRKKQKVSADLYTSGCDFTPYEDWGLTGWPILTMVRGKVVMEDGKVKDISGWGRAANLK